VDFLVEDIHMPVFVSLEHGQDMVFVPADFQRRHQRTGLDQECGNIFRSR